MAYWAIDWLANIRFSTDAPIVFAIEPDWRVQIFSLGIALLTGVISGVFPAFQTSRPDLNESLKEGGRSSAASGRHRIRSLLVVGQVAVSLLVLICGALYQSAKNAEKMDMGFRTENLLMASMDPEAQGYDQARARQFYKQLTERAGTLPGVIGASVAARTPLGYSNSIDDVYFEGRAAGREEEERTTIFSNMSSKDTFKRWESRFLKDASAPIRDAARRRGCDRTRTMDRLLAESGTPGKRSNQTRGPTWKGGIGVTGNSGLGEDRVRFITRWGKTTAGTDLF